MSIQGTPETEHTPDNGSENTESKTAESSFVRAKNKFRGAFASAMPSKKDLEAIAERLAALPPWENTTFSYKLQIKANELEYGQPETPSAQNERKTKRQELIQQTVKSLPQGDNDAEVLKEAMEQFNKCIAAIKEFSRVFANSNPIMNTERQNFFLRKTFDELIRTSEETIVNFEKYITPNESMANSATERKVLQERLQWLEECLTELQSTSSYKKTIPGTGIPILPFMFKSLAHKAGHSQYKDKRARQEAVHRLYRIVRDLQHSLIEGNTVISLSKRIGEGVSEILTRPIGRVWEYIFSARSKIYKLIVGGAVLYGGAHYITKSPSHEVPPQPSTGAPIHPSPDDSDITDSSPVSQPDISAKPAVEAPLTPEQKQKMFDDFRKGLNLKE